MLHGVKSELKGICHKWEKLLMHSDTANCVGMMDRHNHTWTNTQSEKTSSPWVKLCVDKTKLINNVELRN